MSVLYSVLLHVSTVYINHHQTGHWYAIGWELGEPQPSSGCGKEEKSLCVCYELDPHASFVQPVASSVY